jgi:ribulose 1,5-bisphosphate synthetase/thiazole synthase
MVTRAIHKKEVYPSLGVAAISAKAVCSTLRMELIFGDILLSGRRVAEVAIETL